MIHTWYVTYEVQKRGALLKRRSPRETKMFETEAQAKDFARVQFDKGLIVYAGTVNPSLPRRLITSGGIPHWLAQENSRKDVGPDNRADAGEPDK